MSKVSDVLNWWCELALVFFLSAMTVAVFFEVLFRYVVHLPLFWTEEFARYCLVWSSLIGATVAFKKGEHIAVTLFLERFAPRNRRVFMLTAEMSVVVFLVVMLWGGIHLTLVTSRQLSPALRVSMAIPYSSIPITAAVILVHALNHMAKFMASREQKG
jgi:TRAP-type C4-dicarboxylate transport system permease small subunit